ncbi:MAG TPA: hypothetical protein VFN56_02410 [Candidatus Saccharimonadales bacterium]|nr:hypothetical protein [Candidatus Saccharimonadales bacterium]
MENELHTRYVPPAGMNYQPSEYGLDPEHNPGDAMLVRESAGDSKLLDWILVREELVEQAELSDARHDPEMLAEVQKIFKTIHDEIEKRRTELGLTPGP